MNLPARAGLEDIALNPRNYKDEISNIKRHHRILEAFIFDYIYYPEKKIESAHVKTLKWLPQAQQSTYARGWRWKAVLTVSAV